MYARWKLSAFSFTMTLIALLTLSGCAQGEQVIAPPDIHYGEDVCIECNMIISDARFAASYVHEISEGRYENIAFDDIGDMLIHADKNPDHTIVGWYVTDYTTEEWVDATQAHYVHSAELKTPMSFGTAAHAAMADAEQMATELNGDLLDWDGLAARHQAGELIVIPGAAVAHEEGGMAHSHDDPSSHGLLLGEADAGDLRLELFAFAPLHAGYNAIEVHLNDADGAPVSGAELQYEPMMTMANGNHHAAGVENPVEIEAGVYLGAVAFPMPSGPDLGSWSLNVHVNDPAITISATASFDLDIAPAKLIGSFVAPDERKIFLMAVTPTTAPQVGMQSFEIFAMERASATAWPPIDNLTLAITPWMPSMDHGSPNNEAPVSVGEGHYAGQINLTMSGPWEVTISASEEDELLGEAVFEYSVP